MSELQSNELSTDAYQPLDLSSQYLRNSSFKASKFISRSLRQLSSVPCDLSCPICMHLFSKPSMLTCGHSFCLSCIEKWLRENDNASCPTCRAFTHQPIRNIALEHVIDEFNSNQERMSRRNKKRVESLEAPIFRRNCNGGSRRRCRFSVTGPEIIVDGPDSSNLEVHSKGKSSHTMCSLPRFPPHPEEENIGPNNSSFRRQETGRRSERTSPPHHLTVDEVYDENMLSDFKRTSLLRRSLGALQKSVRRKKNRYNCEQDNQGLTRDQVDVAQAGGSVDEISSVRLSPLRKKKSLWKRLLPFSFKRGIVHPSTASIPEDVEVKEPLQGSFCIYTGFGRRFERINNGDEITIVVFGKRGVGKTTLLDNTTLSCEASTLRSVAPLGLHDRMRMGGRDYHAEYRFAHMTSITVQTTLQRFVIDVIDGELEDDYAVAHTSYMHAADAAILLYSCSDSASLLTAMSIHRQLARTVGMKKIPCVLMANVMSSAHRVVSREMGEKTARNIRARYFETSLIDSQGDVLEILETLCRSVISTRRNINTDLVCSVM